MEDVVLKVVEVDKALVMRHIRPLLYANPGKSMILSPPDHRIRRFPIQGDITGPAMGMGPGSVLLDFVGMG